MVKNLLANFQIQDRTSGTDMIFYPVIQIPVIFPTDGKNAGNTNTLSHRQTAGKLQFVRAGVITNDKQPVVLQPDMDFNTWFIFDFVKIS